MEVKENKSFDTFWHLTQNCKTLNITQLERRRAHNIAVSHQMFVNFVFPPKVWSRCGCFLGLFMEPTVFTNVKDDNMIAQEESFGPVMVVSKFNARSEIQPFRNKAT